MCGGGGCHNNLREILPATKQPDGDGDIEPLASEWLRALQRELVRIAARRVDADDVEDVVQDALSIIAAKGIDRGSEPVGDAPPLAWCFRVLRNVIGNHYQRQRTRDRWTKTDSDVVEQASAGGVLESLTSQETLIVVESALDELSRTDPVCAGYLSRMADGARARDVADDSSIERAAFYRRLYRCRHKLRELLRAKGIDA